MRTRWEPIYPNLQQQVARVAAIYMLIALFPPMIKAHTTQQTRIVHIILHHNSIEVYINFLLPRSPKIALWSRMFDRNRNRRLEPSEQQKLGMYLRRYAEKGLTLQIDKKTTPLKWVELQNSRLRGNARQGKYCWDIHLRGHWRRDPKKTAQTLRIRMKPLFKHEWVPVAVVALEGIRLAQTSTSYILRRNQIYRSVCKMSLKRMLCDFKIVVRSKSSSTTKQVTTRPAPKH